MRYAMVKSLRLKYPVPILCRTLDVATSGFYAWIKRPDSKRKRDEKRLELEVIAAHRRTRETYGAERLQRDLVDNGVAISIHRVKRIRRKLRLRCRQKRRFKATTDSRHNLPVAENLLDQNFEASAPNRIWVTDLTYVPTEEGWLYLAGHKDLFTGEVVGYAMGERMTQQLIRDSLQMALTSKRPEAGLLHHSDRGSQYCSRDYVSLLSRHGIKISMSRKGNCYDNAPMESFWGILKSELVHHCRFATRRQAIQAITEYIVMFYNRQRRQARLNYLSPAAFEQMYYEKQRQEILLAA